MMRGCSAGTGRTWGAPRPAATSGKAGGATWGEPSAPATEKATQKLESTGRMWGSTGARKQIPRTQLRGLAPVSSAGSSWGRPGGRAEQVMERQLIGKVVKYR